MEPRSSMSLNSSMMRALGILVLLGGEGIVDPEVRPGPHLDSPLAKEAVRVGPVTAVEHDLSAVLPDLVALQLGHGVRDRLRHLRRQLSAHQPTPGCLGSTSARHTK